MDETAPAASSALRSKESPSPPILDFGSFIFNSSALREGDLTLFVSGFQTVMGMTANGCSTAPPKRLFAFAADLERGYELKTIGRAVHRSKTGPDRTGTGLDRNRNHVFWRTGDRTGIIPVQTCPDLFIQVRSGFGPVSYFSTFAV